MYDAFQLCDKTVVKIGRKTQGKLELDKASPAEQTVILVYQVMGIIGNEGIKGLLADKFDGDTAYKRTICAFREIGSSNLASLLEEAVESWNSVDHSRLDDSQYVLNDDYLDDEHPEVSHRLLKLENQIESLQDDTLNRLGEFIYSTGLQPG